MLNDEFFNLVFDENIKHDGSASPFDNLDIEPIPLRAHESCEADESAPPSATTIEEELSDDSDFTVNKATAPTPSTAAPWTKPANFANASHAMPQLKLPPGMPFLPPAHLMVPPPGVSGGTVPAPNTKAFQAYAFALSAAAMSAAAAAASTSTVRQSRPRKRRRQQTSPAQLASRNPSPPLAPSSRASSPDTEASQEPPKAETKEEAKLRKRMEKQMRNRASAERSRARRKARMQMLERENATLRAQLQAMTIENTKLRNQNARLRGATGAAPVVAAHASGPPTTSIPEVARRSTYMFAVVFCVALWGTFSSHVTELDGQAAAASASLAQAASSSPGDVRLEDISGGAMGDSMFMAGAFSGFLGHGPRTSQEGATVAHGSGITSIVEGLVTLAVLAIAVRLTAVALQSPTNNDAASTTASIWGSDDSRWASVLSFLGIWRSRPELPS